MNRRELLKAAAALPLAQAVLTNPAFAQAPYPSRNVTMIVPFPPGGPRPARVEVLAEFLMKQFAKGKKRK